MADFNFLQNPVSKKWVVSAPRRADRPDIAKKTEVSCPFCPGNGEQEVFKIDRNGTWQVRVLNNKFPFAPIHEVIVHSPDHHKSFGELDLSSTELIFQTFKQRYQTHSKAGNVYIFNNSGQGAGESLTHPHSQLVVIPNNIKLDITPPQENLNEITKLETGYFYIFCPKTSEWPDETWIQTKNENSVFGDIQDNEIEDISRSITRLIQILSLRHKNEFPFNFYIYPDKNWYLRITPRLKSLGGFEIGTGIFVNTQDPKETIEFIKEHFENPDEEKIKSTQQAYYKKAV